MKFEVGVEGKIIRFGIVIFWSIFWLFNVIDKFIGGYTFLWVGSDRFAQLGKFFSSIGVDTPTYPLGALAIIAILEITAFVLITAALWKLVRKNESRARTLYFYGTLVGLIIFSIFSIGDQVFGDRFELLEHTIFWIAIIVSWAAYILFPKMGNIIKINEFWKDYSKEVALLTTLIVILSIFAVSMIVLYGKHEQSEMKRIIEPTHLGEGVYSFSLPFSSKRDAWEQSLTTFINEHPKLRITAIQTMPQELKTKRDNVVIFVITEFRQ